MPLGAVPATDSHHIQLQVVVDVYMGVGVGVAVAVAAWYVGFFLAQHLPCSILESPEQDIAGVI